MKDDLVSGGKLNLQPAAKRRSVIKGMLAGGVTAVTSGLPSFAAADNTISPTPKRGGILRVAITGGTASDTLDAHNAITQPDVYRIMALYDGLVTIDANAKVVNALAETIETDAKGGVWTIRLRSNAKFHDGRPVTAKDVAATFKRITDPKSPTVGSLALAPLDLNSIQYLDDRTLRVSTKTPYAVLPDVIANPLMCGIVPADYDPKKPIGAGPFKFKSMTASQQTEFVRFDEYWNGEPYLDGFTIVEQFATDTAAFNALQGGQIDAFANAPTQLVRQVNGSSTIKALVSYPSEFTPFTMKADIAPFNNPDLRQAMRLLMDRPQFVKLALSGFGSVASDVYGQYDPFFDATLHRGQDLDQAKYLLKKAGQESFNVELTTANISNGFISMAQIFAQQAKKAGVTVNVKVVTPDVYLNDVYTKVPFSQDFFYYSPIMGQPPLSIMPGTFLNETNWTDPDYFKIYAQAQGTVDPVQRRVLIHEMQKIEFDRGSYIIPTYNSVIDLLAKNVMGLPKAKTGYAMGNFGLAKAWLA